MFLSLCQLRVEASLLAQGHQDSAHHILADLLTAGDEDRDDDDDDAIILNTRPEYYKVRLPRRTDDGVIPPLDHMRAPPPDDVLGRRPQLRFVFTCECCVNNSYLQASATEQFLPRKQRSFCSASPEPELWISK